MCMISCIQMSYPEHNSKGSPSNSTLSHITNSLQLHYKKKLTPRLRVDTTTDNTTIEKRIHPKPHLLWLAIISANVGYNYMARLSSITINNSLFHILYFISPDKIHKNTRDHSIAAKST